MAIKVWPEGGKPEIEGRQVDLATYRVAVAVCTYATTTAVKRLVLKHWRTIQKTFLNKYLTTMTSAYCEDVGDDFFDYKLALDNNLFVAPVRLTFRYSEST
jgi:hypothetical protein